MNDKTVYVAEAYIEGERIEQLVHTNYEDALEDIEVCTSSQNPDAVVVHERTLYLGSDDSFEVTR